jgi:uncharacterized membrane protein HdeD (DUF308 family)
MITLSRETSRFATSLIVRGTLLAFLGIAAIGWPDDALVVAMVVAAVLLGVLGAYEMLIAVRTRATTPGWMVPMASGAACVSFAILTLVFPGLALGVTLLLVAVWLVLYASLTGALALAVWPMPRTRNALLGWTLLNVALAVAAVSMPRATIFTLLYVGAGYALAFGALQVASGVWIRRVALPRVGATVQSTWPTPASRH